MIINYKTFDFIYCDDGIILISHKSTDYPFVIINNKMMGFVVFHADEQNYSIRNHIKNNNDLDIYNMTTYLVEIQKHSHWTVTIPFFGKSIKPELHFKFDYTSVHKQFSANDFPNNFHSFNNICIYTGIPE